MTYFCNFVLPEGNQCGVVVDEPGKCPEHGGEPMRRSANAAEELPQAEEQEHVSRGHAARKHK